mgnify:CR=1 FL=1
MRFNYSLHISISIIIFYNNEENKEYYNNEYGIVSKHTLNEQ